MLWFRPMYLVFIKREIFEMHAAGRVEEFAKKFLCFTVGKTGTLKCRK
ncbi:hypothetical protein SAMN04490355_10135 [Pelosinus propionicus DSM 13327]|uniref:Uncharacterized protein n=1 Tax=Pelosinus propionicus DSM 13327 TaxID=1123291 RepID=A0A1I4JLH7_9FIRM|nr:hypothetical protein SAMN04490355_10135 [Pelosinus propionicus DSM 13327]